MNSLFDQSTYTQVAGRIDQLTPTSARQWGKMSVSQMLKHMSTAFGLPLNTAPVRKEPLYFLMANPLSRWLMFGVLPWPHGLPAPQTLLVREDPAFESAKAELLAALERFRTASAFPGMHPVFGEMEKADWGKLMATHIDHHLRQFGV